MKSTPSTSLRVTRIIVALVLGFAIIHNILWFISARWLQKTIELWVSHINEQEDFRISHSQVKIFGWPGTLYARISGLNIRNLIQCKLQIPHLHLQSNIFFPFHKKIHIIGNTTIDLHCFQDKINLKGDLKQGLITLQKGKIQSLNFSSRFLLLTVSKHPIAAFKNLDFHVNLAFNQKNHPHKHGLSYVFKGCSSLDLWTDQFLHQNLHGYVSAECHMTQAYPFLSSWYGFEKWRDDEGKLDIHFLNIKLLESEFQINGQLALDEEMFPQGFLLLQVQKWRSFFNLARKHKKSSEMLRKVHNLFNKLSENDAKKSDLNLSCHLVDGVFSCEKEPLFLMPHIYLP